MINYPVDEYSLENIRRDHRIDLGIFIPFAITRLCENAGDTNALLTVKLRDIETSGESLRRLLLSWAAESLPIQPAVAQERTITELAACAVASAVLARYTFMRIREVTGDGDRFDYWVDDGENEYGLEISGTLSGDCEARHHLKTQQLISNPFGVSGFVIVTSFAPREVICSFHRR